MQVNNLSGSSEAKIYSPSNVLNSDNKDEKAQEVTFIPWEDMNFENTVGKDGKSFEVVHYYKVKDENLDKDYTDVFSEKAAGKSDKCYDYYVENFISEVTKNLSDSKSLDNDRKSLKKSVDSLVNEIKNSNLQGVSNNFNNLKTKFTVNGVDFSFKELMDTSKIMDYSKSILLSAGSNLDYKNYAEMGIAKGQVKSYAEKNLNESQQNLVNENISARINSLINLQGNAYVKSMKSGNREKFYAFKGVDLATNREYAKKVMNTFEDVDYYDKNSFNNALGKYKNLIKTVLESDGIKNTAFNQSLTDVTNYQIKKFESLYDRSYKKVILSVSEVRKMFGNKANLIDVYK